MRCVGRGGMQALQWTCKTYLDWPLDAVASNAVRANIPGVFFSRVSPTPLKSAAVLAAYSTSVLEGLLDVTSASTIADDRDFVDVVSGCRQLSGVLALAHRYGGHQFGHWAGQLGDGRAILIGEYTNKAGERWEMQLKGAGLTPYSRFADGRAVIRSSVREFLCSEAMHYLGVPTSRAGCLAVSDDTVTRDQFYDGRPRRERVAIVLRLAPTWFRFGSLQMAAVDGDLPLLRLLVDHLCQRHLGGRCLPLVDCPLDDDAVFADADDDAAAECRRYVQLAAAIAAATGRMVAHWQAVGFTHGVMNTDNMSVHGITIDYGPFGFVGAYRSSFVPNSSDTAGLYSFGRQRTMAEWNVVRLVEALLFLWFDARRAAASGATVAAAVVRVYNRHFDQTYGRLVAAKLGVRRPPADSGADTDADTEDDSEVCAEAQRLYDRLLDLMQALGECDFTATWRQLAETPLRQVEAMTDSEDGGAGCCQQSHDTWALRRVCAAPEFAAWLADYDQLLRRAAVEDDVRRQRACAACPRYVLHNWLAQRAIDDIEQRNDFAELQRLQRVLERPFTRQQEAEDGNYAGPPPDWAGHLRVSCSS